MKRNLLLCLPIFIALLSIEAFAQLDESSNPHGFSHNLEFSSRSNFGALKAIQQPGRTGQYSNFNILFNNFEVGINQNVSIAVGTMLSPIAFPIYGSVKSTFEVLPLLRVGGAFTVTHQFDDQSWLTSTKHFGTTYTTSAIVGYGDPDYNVTVSTGYIAGNGKIIPMLKLFDFNSSNEKNAFDFGSTWIGSVSAHVRATNNLSVLVEGHLTVAGYAALFGGRVVPKGKGRAWDFGLLNSTIQEWPIPYVGFAQLF